MIEAVIGGWGPGADLLRARPDSVPPEVVPGVGVFAPHTIDVHMRGRCGCLLIGRPSVRGLPCVDASGAAERIVAGYLERGEAALHDLRPPFSCVLWEGEPDRILLVVDPLGTRSIFLMPVAGGMVFATEIEPLLHVAARRPSPDEASLVSWLAGWGLDPSATLYDGISRLAGGHLLRSDERAPRRYGGRRRPAPLEGSPQDLAHAVDAGVSAAVTRASEGADVLGVLLSGGLDSSSVAAAAVKRRGARAVRAFSAMFPDDPVADESSLIAEVRAHLGIGGSWIRVPRAGSMLRDALGFQRRWQVPSLSPTLLFQLPLQRLAASSGATRLVDGEGGDELFGLRAYFLADLLRRGRLPRAWRLAGSLGGWAALSEYGLKGAAPAFLHNVRTPEPPRWLTDRGVALVQGDPRWRWKSASGPRWQAHAWDQLTLGRERSESHQYLARRAAMTGIEAAHPFLEDLDLIELAIRLPPEPAFTSDLDRPFLRAAMVSRLPGSILSRGQKSFFNGLFRAALDGPDRPALERLLGQKAELRSLVRPAYLAEILQTPSARRGGAWAWAAWRLLVAECWLRYQADDRFDERMPELALLRAPELEFVS